MEINEYVEFYNENQIYNLLVIRSKMVVSYRPSWISLSWFNKINNQYIMYYYF